MKGPFDPNAKPRADMIVLCGLDGSGKSTQTALLAERLAAAGIPAEAVWNRWEPRVSAPLIRFAKRRLRSSSGAGAEDYAAFRDAKRRTMKGGLKRSLWQILVWSEYSWEVRGRLAPPRRRGAAVICDRYVHDTLIDIAINFSAPPPALAGLMSHPLLALFPKPSLAIVVDIDPETGAARKSDGTPPAYLADRREYYVELARILNAPVVDGGRPVETVFDEVWARTASWRAERERGKAR
jgi:dTMP kinase